ncbi:radical SAM family heme chaperone HemW [Neorhodopirellula pilleata]|uniref:Heme chaperone HemW n=1 Tax=Neorhodopirellula pilleata TaxID=2714738 RepID=A0A5C5ZZA7_9BACT|nr:radical SAM family heme chaperone HemW [Neorhodopirellula pilleata]TWT92298.1 Oxygen-independent coproporphyrinogen-III oxidase-like protein [Neorhodopirellula pilleata]
MNSAPPGGWPTPRSLYIHVPFCRHRCGYCNFSVVAGRDDLQGRFLHAAETELASIDHPADVPLETVYLGGGTPTQLSMPRLERLIDSVRNRFQIADTVEFTVEANPEDITNVLLDMLVDTGVNRLSLGVQSFDNAKLRLLQRGHTGDQAIDSVRRACESIANVSIDLIFGTSGETIEQWNEELRIASTLPIRHISTYSLTYEKGTQFWSRRRSGELQEVPEDTDIAMYRQCRRRLQAAGFEHYEISSFARPSARSRHNSAYWNGQGWYAVGPGAARFVNGARHVNHRSPTTYIKRVLDGGDATIETEVISLDQHARELAAFGIRQIDGIDLNVLNERLGYDFASELQPIIESCFTHKLLQHHAGRIRLTPRGRLLADRVEMQILEWPENPK